MNALDYTAQALHLGLSLLMLWVLMFGCWRYYRVDALRDRLFDLRDRLFDYAESGAIDFNHPAYGRLRSSLNSMIRFAHRVNFARLVVAVLTHKIAPNHQEISAYREWVKAVQSIPSEETREQLWRFHQEMLVVIVRHMTTGSPVLWFGFALVACWVVVHGATRRVLDVLAGCLPGLDLIESQAVEAQEEGRRSGMVAV
jgi:hypothetical protein